MGTSLMLTVAQVSLPLTSAFTRN